MAGKKRPQFDLTRRGVIEGRSRRKIGLLAGLFVAAVALAFSLGIYEANVWLALVVAAVFGAVVGLAVR